MKLKNVFEQKAKFILGAARIQDIKETRISEIAFIGRSNVGKSSLINSVLKDKIAITSKTPGRTRQLNFFTIENKLNIVDMPGYGYAKVGKNEVKSWEKLSYLYFSSRVNLRRVFLLIDARREILEKDKEMMNIFDGLGVNYQIILTKIDKIYLDKIPGLILKIEETLKNNPASYPKIIATSSNKNIGIEDLKTSINNLVYSL